MENFETVNTHELRDGDVVVYYGCVFRLRDRNVHKQPDDLKYDENGTVTFRTDLLHFEEGSMPRYWAETWVFQGNSRARWNRKNVAA